MNIYRSTLFILLLCLGFSAGAQGFYKTYSPTGSTFAAVAQADNGDYFAAGTLRNDSLLFVVRVNSAGQTVWSVQLNSHHSRTIAAEATTDGGLVVLTEYYNDGNVFKNALLKLSGAGTVSWTTPINNDFLPNGLRDLAPTADGGFLLAGDTRDAQLNPGNLLVKVAADGSIAWTKTYGTAFRQTSRIVTAPDGNFVISGGRNGGDLSLTKVNPAGDLIWEQSYAGTGYERAYDLVATPDNGWAILGSFQGISPQRLELGILKADINGSLAWTNHFYPYDWSDPLKPVPYFKSFALDANGNFYVPLWDGSATLDLLKLDPQGNAISKKQMPASGLCNAILSDGVGWLAIAGEESNIDKAFLIRSDLDGELYFNKIRGNVFVDTDGDCLQSGADPNAVNFTVKAESATEAPFYKKVEADGTYEIRVPPGQYQITAQPNFTLADFYSQCDTPTVTIAGPADIVDNQTLGMQSLASCPMLEIEIGEGPLRRCMNTSYTVNLCNFGNATAGNVSVEIAADAALSYVSSTLPLTGQNGNIYTFDTPDLQPAECISFYVNFLVDCEATLGEVICVEAHALPDSSCLPQNINWDGSELRVHGECAGNQILFTMSNVGAGDMTHALDYVIIEDHIMLMQGHVQLESGRDSTFTLDNPTGACYMNKVYPNAEKTTHVQRGSAVVENCTANGNLNLALEFNTGENDAAYSTSCREITGSFDPNDKTATPRGWSDAHIIEANEDIEYQIRFQNTGNDTAFLVVIRDELPTQTLQPGTLRPVAASHPYIWNVAENGVATFTFPGIELPDSNVNEAASHGFIKFRISQQPNLPKGTYIKNSAAIYFDFNPPVITNEYFHTVGSPLVSATSDPTSLLDIQVVPNPFSDETRIVLKDYSSSQPAQFRLTDALGNVLRKDTFSGDTYLFRAAGLSAGIYFFQVESDGVLLASGKMLLSH